MKPIAPTPLQTERRNPRLRALVAGLTMAFTVGFGTAAETPTSLDFDATKFTVQSGTVNGKTIQYRAYEGIVYVKNPVDVKYQTLNLYVPVEYYQSKTVGNYSADTAPILFPNSVGGYMPGAAGKPGAGFDGSANAGLVALSKGLVVAYPGARGRSLVDASGTYYGKAPAAIVDLKAAVRYLRFNDNAIPGSAEKIISNGTSAGGALSSLLGASGNNADYAPYLKALGAAEARDDVYAVSAYCPIINLENADAAYEWLLGTLKETKAGGFGPPPSGAGGPPAGSRPSGDLAAGGAPTGGGAPAVGNPFGAPSASSGPLTPAQIALSARLKALFPSYVNTLGLKAADGTKLTLNAEGTGTFLQEVQNVVIKSAQKAVDAGKDLSKETWVTIKSGKVTAIDWNAYLAASGRKKGVPAFDGLDASIGENNLFGTANVNNLHFTAFGLANDTAKVGMADSTIIKMMNPMSYVGAPGTTTSPNWRVRHGTVDSDTAIAISVILADRLANTGLNLDYALVWDQPHSGDYDLEELFAWIAKLK